MLERVIYSSPFLLLILLLYLTVCPSFYHIPFFVNFVDCGEWQVPPALNRLLHTVMEMWCAQKEYWGIESWHNFFLSSTCVCGTGVDKEEGLLYDICSCETCYRDNSSAVDSYTNKSTNFNLRPKTMISLTINLILNPNCNPDPNLTLLTK